MHMRVVPEGDPIENARTILRRAAEDSAQWSTHEEIPAYVTDLMDQLRDVCWAIAKRQYPHLDRNPPPPEPRKPDRPSAKATREDILALDRVVSSLKDLMENKDLFRKALQTNPQEVDVQKAKMILMQAPMEIFQAGANLMIFSNRGRRKIDVRKNGFDFSSGSLHLNVSTARSAS